MPSPASSAPSVSPKRFRIAFSFAGQKRDFVQKVASILATKFSEDKILYDKYHEAEFARHNLGTYLPDLYHKQSDLVVAVFCADYERKAWCGLEWTAIHDLLKQRKEDEVMLCRFDHVLNQGLYSTAGFIELDHKTPEAFATLILERLALNEGLPKTSYTASHPAISTTAGGGPSPAPIPPPPPSAVGPTGPADPALLTKRLLAMSYSQFLGVVMKLGMDRYEFSTIATPADNLHTFEQQMIALDVTWQEVADAMPRRR